MPLLQNIEEFNGVSAGLQWAIFIVGCLIVLVALCSGIVSIWLSIKYFVYNRRQNSAGLTGDVAARRILDNNGLQNIRVSVVGSLLFGNSYSHFFRKVRLRRLTIRKTSITSLAMGAEKSCLAILDKEGDKDMKTRIILTPLMLFGPYAFIPLLALGIALDVVIFGFTGVPTIVAACLGLGFFVASFVLSILTLKTEKKAQDRACEVLLQEGMATDEEVELMRKLFKLYNIQYVNDVILQFLQIILKILQIVAKVQQNSSHSSN